MADAESAFLDAQMDEYDPTAPPGDYGLDVQSPSDESASMPESAVNTPPVNEGTLKPQPVEAIATTPSKQLRSGPFQDDSSEDEVEVAVSNPRVTGLNASGVSSPQRSHTHTPSNTLAPSNVPLHSSSQDQAHSGVSSSSSVTVHDAALAPASQIPNGSTPVPDADATKPADTVHNLVKTEQAHIKPEQTAIKMDYSSIGTAFPSSSGALLASSRLPQDRVGILNDRIKEDPRGDTEAWLSLIEEHRRRHKIEDARAVFDQFLALFPHAPSVRVFDGDWKTIGVSIWSRADNRQGQQWVEYVNMELDMEEFGKVDAIFAKSLFSCPYVELWKTYLNYVRRRQNLTTDPGARKVISDAYKITLETVGHDILAGQIWTDYIEFLKTAPGVVGGREWQDGQKTDTLRKAYQQAVAVPTRALLDIWREYDKFEMSLNKATGRRNLQDRSPYYMNARGYLTKVEQQYVTGAGLIRTTLPKLPPAPGFDGYDEYMEQVRLWKAWIDWEKVGKTDGPEDERGDPLGLKDDDPELFKKRIVYIYKHAFMALRFWPEMWYEAAAWCFENGLDDQGNEFLDQGMDANPESCLLAFRKAHQIELTYPTEGGEAGAVAKGQAVRVPFNRVLDTLYDLTTKTKEREQALISQMKKNFEAQQAAELAARARSNSPNGSDEYDPADVGDEEAFMKQQQQKEAVLQEQLRNISAGFNIQMTTLKKTISYAWIALMRTMRRIQGKGRPDAPAGVAPGFRGIFAESRKKGKLLSDAYVASALIEHHCYQDPAATKIFDRGMKLFPDDEHFALEYIKHLVKQNDATNARAVFETVVKRLTEKPESVARAKPLFLFFHDYESQFGELSQIVKLEKRMRDHFPEDPQLLRFAQRFSTPKFDPTTVRPIISPKTQMRPTLPAIIPTVEEPQAPMLPVPPQLRQPSPVVHSPRMPAAVLAVNSPKRQLETFDDELSNKRVRAESPLKGAAGRRLAASRGIAGRATEGAAVMSAAAPTPLPRDVNILLGMIPPAHTYRETRFDAARMVALLQGIDLSRAQFSSQAPTPVPTGAPVQGWAPPPPISMPYAPPPTGYYGR